MSPKGKSKCAGKGKGRARKKAAKARSPSKCTDDVELEVSLKPLSPLTDHGQTEDGSVSQEENPSETNKTTNSASAGRSRRKEKKSSRLKDEQEEGEILEWIEEHPCLWNLKHKEYKNKGMKDRLWTEKASELGYDGKSNFKFFVKHFCQLHNKTFRGVYFFHILLHLYMHKLYMDTIVLMLR